MRNYLIKTPRLLKALYSQCIWHVNDHANSIYITFDDGPHPTATSFVLDELEKYQAKASFFCIGKNVLENQLLFQQIIENGHTVGNHTHNHLNGWKTRNSQYFRNIKEAQKHINSNLFRPPYGRITYSQALGIEKMYPNMKIIMWDVLSGDFDTDLTPEACLENVLSTVQPGSIVVFHDSEKAWPRLQYVLPRFLTYCQEMGWNMKRLKF